MTTTDTVTLTDRELYVLRRIAAGASQLRIGRSLGIGHTGAAMLASRMYQKLGATNAPNAVYVATQRNLLDVPRAAEQRQVVGGITPHEIQLLTLLSHGARYTDIARVLLISVHTVNVHLIKLYRKLGALDKGHAVGIAYRAGLLPTGPVQPTGGAL